MSGYFKWDSGQAETPPTHKSSHENGGADEISVAGLSGELADGQPPKIHATSHQSGGGDAIKLDDLAAPDDNTDLDVSIAKHGLTPKAPNDTKKYLRGDGTWVQISVPTFLTTPLISTSWDGDSFSDTSKTLIDLSSVFGAPGGIKAVLLDVSIRDSGSAGTDCSLILSPNNTAYEGLWVDCSGQTNDSWERQTMIVPCDANGDIYYQVDASGTGTMDIYLRIWGYWI